MTSYEAPMRMLFGCLITLGIAIGAIIAAIAWYISQTPQGFP